MKQEPQKEHQWLQKLVGEWAYKHEADMGPDKPKECVEGREVVRPLGGFWVIGEGRGQMPASKEEAVMQITIGYDPAKKKYVGSWVGSMMPMMWVYEGFLDPTEKILTLECTGPSFTDPTKTALYQDIIEFKSDDLRLFRSQSQNPDGTWTQFMTAEYRRVK